MRLVIFCLLLFGIAQTSAYSEPGAYERVLLYYLYSIDCQLHGDKSTKIAPGCRGTGANPCTLDQLLRYIAVNPNSLPTRNAPATSYPRLPDMDQTAQGLAIKDSEGRDFAGQIKTKVAVPNASSEYSKFLSQLGSIALGFAHDSPENRRDQAVRSGLFATSACKPPWRHSCRKETLGATRGLDVKSKPIPLYDGAPDNLIANVVDARATIKANEGLTVSEFSVLWEKNAEGGHIKNTNELA